MTALNDAERLEYLHQLTEALAECLIPPESNKYALLIVADATTGFLRLFTVNADEASLPPLLMAAAQIVHFQPVEARITH